MYRSPFFHNEKILTECFPKSLKTFIRRVMIKVWFDNNKVQLDKKFIEKENYYRKVKRRIKITNDQISSYILSTNGVGVIHADAHWLTLFSGQLINEERLIPRISFEKKRNKGCSQSKLLPLTTISIRMVLALS